MSEAAAELVVPGAHDAASNAVDDVNDHTPDPETPAVAEKLPDPPEPVEGIAELRTLVEGLATTVATLTGLVTDKVVDRERDTSPQSLPWTHLGGHAKDES
jgi:hypothetical protein